MKKTLLALWLGLFSTVLAGDSWVEITPPQDTHSGERIEVLEFFWYGCPHCYRFEPYLQQWHEDSPDDVVLVQVPAVSSKAWLPHARAFYTAMTLDILEDHHQALYDTIHQDKRPLLDEKALQAFFEDRGVDGGEFQRVYRSEEVDQLVKRAYLMTRNYKISGVPALIVNGRYMTSPSAAGGAEQAMAAVQQLIERERRRLDLHGDDSEDPEDTADTEAPGAG